MSEPQIDPAGNTQQFKAFAQRSEREAAKEKPSYVLPAIIVGVVIVAIVVAVLILR